MYTDPAERNTYRDPIAEERLRLIEQMWADDDGMPPPPRGRDRESEGEPPRWQWVGVITLETYVRIWVVMAAVLAGLVATSAAFALGR